MFKTFPIKQYYINLLKQLESRFLSIILTRQISAVQMSALINFIFIILLALLSRRVLFLMAISEIPSSINITSIDSPSQSISSGAEDWTRALAELSDESDLDCSKYTKLQIYFHFSSQIQCCHYCFCMWTVFKLCLNTVNCMWMHRYVPEFMQRWMIKRSPPKGSGIAIPMEYLYRCLKAYREWWSQCSCYTKSLW